MGISFEQPLALLLLAPALGSVLYLWRQSRRGREGMRGRLIPGLPECCSLRFWLWRWLFPPFAIRSTGRLWYLLLIFQTALRSNALRLKSSSGKQWRQEGQTIKQASSLSDATPWWSGPLPEREDFGSSSRRSAPTTPTLPTGFGLAAALLPPNARQRIVVISDGQENLGDALEQARFLRAQGVQVDVARLEGPSGPEVLVASVIAPSSANIGERVPVEVTVGSAWVAGATLQVSLDGAVVAARQVTLEPGETRFSFDVGIDRPGFHTIRATVDSETDTRFRNNRADAFVNVLGFSLGSGGGR